MTPRKSPSTRSLKWRILLRKKMIRRQQKRRMPKRRYWSYRDVCHRNTEVNCSMKCRKWIFSLESTTMRNCLRSWRISNGGKGKNCLAASQKNSWNFPREKRRQTRTLRHFGSQRDAIIAVLTAWSRRSAGNTAADRWKIFCRKRKNWRPKAAGKWSLSLRMWQSTAEIFTENLCWLSCCGSFAGSKACDGSGWCIVMRIKSRTNW